jgi:hypothetical protein
MRSHRMGPAYERVIDHPESDFAESLVIIKRDFDLDPYAADLNYHRARLLLKLGQKEGYDAAIQALKRLTPHFDLAVLTRRGPE